MVMMAVNSMRKSKCCARVSRYLDISIFRFLNFVIYDLDDDLSFSSRYSSAAAALVTSTLINNHNTYVVH